MKLQGNKYVKLHVNSDKMENFQAFIQIPTKMTASLLIDITSLQFSQLLNENTAILTLSK